LGFLLLGTSYEVAFTSDEAAFSSFAAAFTTDGAIKVAVVSLATVTFFFSAFWDPVVSISIEMGVAPAVISIWTLYGVEEAFDGAGLPIFIEVAFSLVDLAFAESFFFSSFCSLA